MRIFSAVVTLLAVLNIFAVGQEHVPSSASQAQELDLAKYNKALAYFAHIKTGVSESPIISPADVAALIEMANLDPTLAKAPNVKAETINVFRDIETWFNGMQNAGQKFDELSKNHEDLKMYATAPSRTTHRTRRLRKEYHQNEDEMNKHESDVLEKYEQLKDSIDLRIEALTALEETPEGQQFTMSRDSKFYAALQYPALPGLGQKPGVVSVLPFQVISSQPDGFFAYLMQVKKGPDGTSLKDSENNDILEADKSKSVFISGHTQPVWRGEYVRLNVWKSG